MNKVKKPMLNIVLFGPPGSGKGTQSAKLINKYGLVHLSTGDIFRANIKEGTELGNLAKSYIEKGQLVPDEVTIKMLESECSKTPKAKGFIFDGFPRTQAQAKALDKFLKSKSTGITMMLALEVDEEELKKRLLLRGKESGRPDDQNPEVIQKRIDVYNTETMPVKDYYSAQGKYKGVNGIGPIDTIFNALCDIIDASVELSDKSKTSKQAKAQGAKKTITKKKIIKAVATPKKALAKTANKLAAKKKTAKKSQTAKGKISKQVAKKAAAKAVRKKVVKPVAAKKKAAAKKTAKSKSAVKKSVVAKKLKTVKKTATKKVAKTIKASNKKRVTAKTKPVSAKKKK